MALNPSGAISLGGTTAGQSIALEISAPGTAQISLNDAGVRTLAGPTFTTPGTVIIMPTDFYGKSSVFSFNVSSGTDVNLRSAAISAGWPGSGAVLATIQPGTTIQSSSTGGYALTINGSWPGGVTLDNRGLIVGRGGNGGNGGRGSPLVPAAPGAGAGTGVLVSVPVTINNPTGIIAGGGGGGGGGGASATRTPGGGGGGGGGIGVSSGGTGAAGSNTGGPGTPGGGGTTTSAGSGGAGGSSPNPGGNAGPGGAGGGYGSGGASGVAGSPVRPGGSGGAAGNSLSGNPFVSWPTGFGTTYGNIV
jgi:hypothetical protein